MDQRTKPNSPRGMEIKRLQVQVFLRRDRPGVFPCSRAPEAEKTVSNQRHHRTPEGASRDSPHALPRHNRVCGSVPEPERGNSNARTDPGCRDIRPFAWR